MYRQKQGALINKPLFPTRFAFRHRLTSQSQLSKGLGIVHTIARVYPCPTLSAVWLSLRTAHNTFVHVGWKRVVPAPQSMVLNLCPPRSAHTAPMPVPAGSLHAHAVMKYYKSFRVGRATRRCDNVCRYMAGPWLKKEQNCKISYDVFFVFFSSTERNPTLRLLVQ